jgi:hypothetical protein
MIWDSCISADIDRVGQDIADGALMDIADYVR